MHTEPRGTTPNEASNKNITYIQRKYLYKEREIAAVLKGKLDNNKSPTPHD